MSCGTCSEETKRGAAAATPLKGVLGIGAPTATGAASPRLNAETLRYLSGPIIAHQGGEDEVPDWLRQAIPQARRELVERGEATLATEEEACAYLMTASLALPLDHNWAGTYIWIASRVCGKHSLLPHPLRVSWEQGQNFWTALGHDAPQSLNRNQESDLWKLREWLRRTVSKNGKANARRPARLRRAQTSVSSAEPSSRARKSAAAGNDGSPVDSSLPTAKTAPRKAKTKAKGATE
jgi:hypothetical protein